MSDNATPESTKPTTTTTTTKTWAKEQTWIKDVLSKSGTELVQLTTNKLSSLKISKEIVKENDQDSQNNTMVYYQSAPMVIKSEQPSQSQLCGSLRTNSTEHQPPLHSQQQHPSISSYALNNMAITMEQQQQQLQQLSLNNCNNTSINNHHQQQQQQYVTNIKTELLPPGITLYATSQPASLAPLNQNVSSSTSTPLPTSTTASVGGRKVSPNKPKFKCEQCGMTFGSKSAHTSHTKSHAKSGGLSMFSGGNPMALTSNGLKVNNTGLPKPKLNGKAAGKNDILLECNVCLKSFAVQARLIRHYRTHTGERPFQCDFCHKQFSVKENLQVHRRIHTKERPYKCDVCGRAFEHSGKLHRHMRIHTGERPHKCSVCAKTFIQSGQLVIHMRTHTGEKPYKCPVEGCGKGFTCSKQLKVHSRTHTGEKPYHCDICFRDFGYNHVLKLHRVQHYGSKCYKCTICEETFKSKKEMEAHIKGHSKDIPDDEEEAAAEVANDSTPNSTSPTSGVDTISGPNSPQSPSSSVSTTASKATTITKQRKPSQEKTRSIRTSGPLSPGSPGSPSCSMSPSSSYASGSRHSAASPTSSVASTTMSLNMETDHHSRDSGVATNAMPTTNSTRHLAAATLIDISHQGSFPIDEEMPTDLSITQQGHQYPQNDHQNGQHQHATYHYQNSPPSPQQPQQYHYLNNSPVQQQTIDLPHPHHTSPQPHGHAVFEQPTINPALLEAATIASRREVDGQQADDVQQAAIQIMQLHHSQQKSNSLVADGNSTIYTDLHHGSPSIHHSLITPLKRSPSGHQMLMDSFDDSQEPNDLIEYHKRGELARHGLVMGHAPVPKFETSEIILRQVEAAIAPLRSSTESPERSSSPESDSMMLMADRDVMTLPLRKRKLYMSDVADSAGGELDSDGAKEIGQQVVRHSSVIQFAKAS